MSDENLSNCQRVYCIS